MFDKKSYWENRKKGIRGQGGDRRVIRVWPSVGTDKSTKKPSKKERNAKD